jgi:hypothetical protein
MGWNFKTEIEYGNVMAAVVCKNDESSCLAPYQADKVVTRPLLHCSRASFVYCE